MAEQVLRNRERYGFTYYTVHGPFMDTFAPVIERVRADPFRTEPTEFITHDHELTKAAADLGFPISAPS